MCPSLLIHVSHTVHSYTEFSFHTFLFVELIESLSPCCEMRTIPESKKTLILASIVLLCCIHIEKCLEQLSLSKSRICSHAAAANHGSILCTVVPYENERELSFKESHFNELFDCCVPVEIQYTVLLLPSYFMVPTFCFFSVPVVKSCSSKGLHTSTPIFSPQSFRSFADCITCGCNSQIFCCHTFLVSFSVRMNGFWTLRIPGCFTVHLLFHTALCS